MFIKLNRLVQPRLECGPTALKMVMEYLSGKDYDLDEIIKDADSIQKYVDWDFKLGTAAIKRGFKATIFTLSIDFFDPTWHGLSRSQLLRKLRQRLKFVMKYNKKDLHDGYIWWWYESSLKAIIKFLEKGGKIVFKPITKELIISYLSKGVPVICPVNGSLMYGRKRFYRKTFDDVKGKYFGHVITATGYENNRFTLTDTYEGSKRNGLLKVDRDLLINSILLSTGDLIVIQK